MMFVVWQKLEQQLLSKNLVVGSLGMMLNTQMSRCRMIACETLLSLLPPIRNCNLSACRVMDQLNPRKFKRRIVNAVPFNVEWEQLEARLHELNVIVSNAFFSLDISILFLKNLLQTWKFWGKMNFLHDSCSFE